MLAGVQVQRLTSILAFPFAALMLIAHGASLQLKGIPANQVCDITPWAFLSLLLSKCICSCASCAYTTDSSAAAADDDDAATILRSTFRLPLSYTLAVCCPGILNHALHRTQHHTVYKFATQRLMHGAHCGCHCPSGHHTPAPLLCTICDHACHPLHLCVRTHKSCGF